METPSALPARKAPSDLLALANAEFALGCVVAYSTATRVVRFTPKLVAKLRAAGAEPFRLGKDGTLQAYAGYTKGKARYDRISLTDGTLLVRLESSAG